MKERRQTKWRNGGEGELSADERYAGFNDHDTGVFFRCATYCLAILAGTSSDLLKDLYVMVLPESTSDLIAGKEKRERKRRGKKMKGGE